VHNFIKIIKWLLIICREFACRHFTTVYGLVEARSCKEQWFTICTVCKKIPNMKNQLALLALMAMMLSSCEAVAGIFKAGMGFGIFIVVFVIVLIAILLFRRRR
jgi:hypothetical protein